MSNLISRLSKQASSINIYKVEHKESYYLLYAFKTLISIFSIITAYVYLYSLLIPFLGYMSHFCTTLSLLFIEATGYFIYNRTAKYFIRSRYFNAIIYLLFSILIFTSSFILSTSGIAQLTTEKVSNIVEITNQKRLEKKNINSLYKSQISEYKASIELIKKNPSGWSGGRRSVLLREQLRQISDLNTKIFDVRTKQANEIVVINKKFEALKQLDKKQTTGTAANYYLAVGILLILQLIASIVIVFMSSQIYGMDSTADYIKEDLKNIKENLLSNIRKVITLETKAITSLVSSEMELQSVLSDSSTIPLTAFAPETETVEEVVSGPGEIEIKKQVHKVVQGFRMNNARTTDVNARTTYVTEQHEDNESITDNKKIVDYGRGTCPNCKTKFKKNSHNHKYCKELCRLEFNEKSKGYDLSKYKKLNK